MRAIVLLSVFFFSFSLKAVAPTTLRSELTKLLPAELAQLSFKDSKAQLEKKFADKIKASDKDALYLHFFGEDNDVTIGLKNGHFDYLYVKLPSTTKQNGKELFRRSMAELTPKEKEENIARWKKEETEHEAGRFITVNVPRQKLKLEFYNNENRDLRSVVMWPLEGEKK